MRLASHLLPFCDNKFTGSCLPISLMVAPVVVLAVLVVLVVEEVQ